MGGRCGAWHVSVRLCGTRHMYGARQPLSPHPRRASVLARQPLGSCVFCRCGGVRPLCRAGRALSVLVTHHVGVPHHNRQHLTSHLPSCAAHSFAGVRTLTAYQRCGCGARRSLAAVFVRLVCSTTQDLGLTGNCAPPQRRGGSLSVEPLRARRSAGRRGGFVRPGGCWRGRERQVVAGGPCRSGFPGSREG